ncbi:MAG TPA: hypothetical protein VEI52_26965 [Terriglobales bacterium]|nr:hypothetical protein [Terriglobales bacterium]
MAEGAPSVAGSATRLGTSLAVVLIAVMAVATYAFHEHTVAKRLAEQNSAVNSTLKATQDQVSSLAARLKAFNTDEPAEKWTPPHSVFYGKPLSAASRRKRIDDPRWKKMQAQLDEQAKQIDSTRQDLTNTRTQLEGSIATTHDELVILEKKGERSYHEFDLDKSGQFQREGPLGVRLRKANAKHEYADLEMLVDDFKVSKKHINIYEPVVFYSADRKMPIELVINSIGKNHIHGYISEPKYKAADLEAMANSASPNKVPDASGLPASSPAQPSPARQQLPPPAMN